MPWNYEKGCDEAVAYTALNSHGGPLTPRAGPIIDPDRTREDQATMVARVHDWQQKETWLKLKHGGTRYRKTTVEECIDVWEKAEMAIAGWDRHGKIDSFRAGYLEWLAKGNQVADQVALSDLEISELPLLERLVAKGYRELAKTEHPDAGGDSDRFDKLKNAKLQLDRLLVEMREILESA